jgi:SAM-dependent methyltransferase
MAIPHTPQNAAQIEFWNGDVGTAWAENHTRMDELLEPISRNALNALSARRGERVLDVGCGRGDTTLRLAAAGAKATGIDISTPMLTLARKRAGDRKLDVEFRARRCDDTPLRTRVRCALSRLGDVLRGSSRRVLELARALVANGRVTFVCWQEPRENPWIALPMNAARPFLPDQQPMDPHAPGPFAFTIAVT